MNAAQRVVNKFGGQSALAKLIGKGQSTVQYWTRSGSIPVKWQAELLQVAADQRIDLSPADFINIPETTDPPKPPVAQWSGVLSIGDEDDDGLPCYVLDDGRRVISRTGATSVLAGKKGGGQLEKYLAAGALPQYMPADLQERMIDFTIPEVTNKTVRGCLARFSGKTW